MKRIVKITAIATISIFLIFCTLFIFDMADYDKAFINRKALVFSPKNLNSRHSHKIFASLKNNFRAIGIKLSKKYNDRWSIESADKRLEYPIYKIIPAKQDNFSKPMYKNKDYNNDSNWPRSHGNNFSTRFSALKNINKENVNKLELAWTYKSGKPRGLEIQANPVVKDGIIFMPAPPNKIVSIDGKNGEEIWNFSLEKGQVARRGLLIWKSNSENFSRILFTDNISKLIALNAKTGKKVKTFGNDGEIDLGAISPIAPLIIDDLLIVGTFKPDLQVYNALTGKLIWKYYLRDSNDHYSNFEGGKPWGGISADKKRGIVFLTTGNPAPHHLGTTRPGDNLYSNSIIAIDIKNKKKLWHFQEIKHDIWNFDLAAPPILTKIKKNNFFVDVVIGISKLGNTIILDRVAGEPIFEFVKKRAPTSKIPGERTAIYQPDAKLPEPICRNQFKKEYITNIGVKNYKHVASIIENANFGFPAPYEMGKKNITISSCVRWAGASVDTTNNKMYVSADNLATLIEIKLNPNIKFGYYSTWEPFVDPDGYPGIKPPWGTLTSMDLNTGKILWQVPLGEHEKLTKKGIPITGTSNRSGATATAGGLVFVSGTEDNKIRAFDSSNGKELWSYKMPHQGSAPPTIYKIEGKEYVIIPAFEKGGDQMLAFSIK